MNTWDAVEPYALSLPETGRSTSYSAAAIKVAGKAFVTVRTPHDEKLVLLQSDSDTFWQTPHYEGWPVCSSASPAPIPSASSW